MKNKFLLQQIVRVKDASIEEIKNAFSNGILRKIIKTNNLATEMFRNIAELN